MNVRSLSIKLEARSAVHCCLRAYQIDLGADLFHPAKTADQPCLRADGLRADFLAKLCTT